MVSFLFSKMSIDGSGNVNVFFSSQRVNFGEPPTNPTNTATSLLTFADMVLALDHKHVIEAAVLESSCRSPGKRDSDHTYASSGSTRTTRSQTAKAAAQLAETKMHDDINKQDSRPSNSSSVFAKEIVTGTVNEILDKNQSNLKNKRCSSVENITNAIKSDIDLDTNDSVSRACEWPFIRNSPRKSSSFEEVCFDNNGKSNIKTCNSTECVQRPSVSHRLVNDTLEFPCWPRKADHTYATATWDGTAASHCLFEQETAKDNVSEDHDMEIADHDYICQRLNKSCEPTVTEQQKISQNLFQPTITQKEDHTYVKPKTILSCSPQTIETVLPIEDSIERHHFSSATFPRQKTRDDHTYFHSGLARKSFGIVPARDWSSAQNVAVPFLSQEKYIEEVYRSLQSSSQSSYAKKDHNYSTST